MSLLLQKGADINIRDNEGYTALAWALHYGHLEVVSVLLLSGANPDIKNKRGFVALDYFLDKNLIVIDDLFDFVKKFRKEKEYKKGIQRFLNKKEPFYLIETEKLASVGKKISLLKFLINKECVFLKNHISLGLHLT